MPSSFKPLLDEDQAMTRTLVHEAIPITGTIVSGTYAGGNTKDFTSGLVQQVYDYPYLSSSANHIFDITCGYSPTSTLSASAVADTITTAQDIANKINMYNEMAQVLMGHDLTGSIREFDQDGDIGLGGTKLKEVYILNFSRLLIKDEIKKGSFVLTMMSGNTYGTPGGVTIPLGDYNAQNDFRVNSPAGEYGIIYTSSATPNTGSGVGLLYYQAGICVLTASVFGDSATGVGFDPADQKVTAVLSGSSIISNADDFRHRFENLIFNNTTELNSKIYFCRVNHNEFNYSNNPTYLSASQIVVKTVETDAPVSYITTVGLYSHKNQLMAVAKLSEPLKKDPNNELILRVRLDY